MNEEELMRLAIKEAKKGEKPGYGSIIVKNGEVIAKAHNSPKKDYDPTSHAEIKAIRLACKKLKTSELKGCILFTTCEPCPMCSSAAWFARLKIVYGAKISDIIKIGRRQINVSCEYLNKKGTYQIPIKGGFLKKECLELYKKSK